MKAAVVTGVLWMGFALGACAPAKAPEPAPEPEKLTIAPEPAPLAPDVEAVPVIYAEGFGPIKVGMTREEAIAVAGAPDAPLDPAFESEACETFRGANFPNVDIMVEDGLVTRVSAFEAPAQSDRGIAIGSKETDLVAAYPEGLTPEPHKYVEGGEDLYLWFVGDGSTPDSRGVRYETSEQDIVTAIHGGGPSIQYVEGCL